MLPLLLLLPGPGRSCPCCRYCHEARMRTLLLLPLLQPLPGQGLGRSRPCRRYCPCPCRERRLLQVWTLGPDPA